MARGKEAAVVLVDVGSSICAGGTKQLEDELKAVALLVQQKILHNKKDELSLVLYGSVESDNALKGDGYEHVSVVKIKFKEANGEEKAKELYVPTIELLKKLERLTPGKQNADFLDALIVGMDILAKAVGTKSVKKTIFLFTEAGCAVNEDGLDGIQMELRNSRFHLNVMYGAMSFSQIQVQDFLTSWGTRGIGFDEVDDDGQPLMPPKSKSKVKRHNEKVLRQLCANVDSEESEAHVLRLEDAQWSLLRKEPTSRMTTFRGFMEISPDIKIPVWSYPKISEGKFLSATKKSKISLEAPNPNGEERTHDVHPEGQFFSKNDPDNEVDKDQIVKGYRYGKSLVTFAEADEENLKFRSTPCLVVLGFTPVSSIPRAHFMAPIEVICSLPADVKAATACSALIHAMAETDRVAIVRFVKRMNALPMLGALLPQITPKCEFFYFVKLPFLEDVRPYAFTPIIGDQVKDHFRPSEKQLAVTDRLIEMLDINEPIVDKDGESKKLYKPSKTFNPAMEYFHQTLQHKALHEDDPILPISPELKATIDPRPELLQKAKPALDEFRESFPLHRAPEAKEGATKRRVWSEAFLKDKDITLESYVGGEGAQKKFKPANEKLSLEALIGGGVESIGPLNPVEDFRAMFKRRDVDLVEKSVREMKALIVRLVTESVKQSHYAKALECLVELRNGCTREDEGIAFNELLNELKRLCVTQKRQQDFWKLLVQQKITLLTQTEAVDSNVTKEEADRFLEGDEVDAMDIDEEPEKPKRDDDEDNAEDLLKMLE